MVRQVLPTTSEPPLPPRTPWREGFPDVVIHTNVPARDAHIHYRAAKSGDADAALALARDLLDQDAIDVLRALVGNSGAILLPISALEVTGYNAIPDAMAGVLVEALGWPLSAGQIVQNNRVGHTRAPSFNRIVTPAVFEGRVISGADYVLVDDHVGLGGTLASLKGYVEEGGGHVIAMTTLTESREARQIALRPDRLRMLQERHGEGLENLWRERFGYGVERLTNVEAGILYREQSLVSVRARLAQAAIEARGRGLIPAVQNSAQ